MTRGLGRMILGALAAGSLLPALANADAPEATPVCYDARVLATLVRQVPTPFPDCGDDCIVMSWPWILDLDVESVLAGRAPRGRITVLNVQHTYMSHARPGRFWLRRNTLGGFNILRLGDGPAPRRCPKTAPPVHPYITPREGQTLEDLRREGQSQYGDGL
jgi:hypothetical protein